MTELKLVPTNCRFCGYQCGLTAYIQDRRVIRVKPDASRFPGDNKILRGCKRWRLVPEVMEHPLRVNFPLKRVGERGGGQYQRISWEEALDDIAEKLLSLKEKFGPEMLATSIGGPHTTFWPLHRFMTLFGSPNNIGIGQICWNPGILVNTITYGWPIDMELDPINTSCAMLWGVNPAESDNSLFWHSVLEYRQEEKPLIVVDPRRTRTAEQATLWLPVRPGTDVVLALGLLHTIIADNLYDHRFVDAWCHGFDQLVEHLQPYTPSYVQEITGVNSDSIIQAARLFAQNTPATLFSGRGIDQLGPNSFQTHRALAILRAITGNLDAHGASHLSKMPDFIPEIDLELSERFSPALREKQLGKDELIIQTYKGYERIRELTMKHGKRLPMRYLSSAHPNLVWKAMLTGKPYSIRSMIVMASNPLLTQADTQLIYQALKSLDLLVVLELFQTPTSMLADYVLPSAGVLERPLLETKAGTANIAYGGDQAVQPYYERRPDFYFWKELGLRLGQENDWPWETYHHCLEDCLAPAGLSWDEFCKTGLFGKPHEYHKYEDPDPQKRARAGFATTTGKVELYSELLKELGCDPLPTPRTFSKQCDQFPLELISGARFHPYYASSFRQLESLRAIHPEPWAEMSQATAERLGLEDGCPIWVETDRGKVRFSTKIAQMRDEVVSVEYGWWYPEMNAAEPELSGLWLANANVLTNADFASCDPLVGTWTYNGIACRVIRA